MFAISPMAVPPSTPVPVAPAAALVVESHGYRYTVRGYRLLSPTDVREAMLESASPTDAVETLRQAYLARGYFLVAVVGRERKREVQVDVVEGRLAHVDGPPELAACFDDLLGRADVRQDQVTRRSVLAQAQAATDGQQPRFEFVPSAEPGASTLRITEIPLAHAQVLSGSLAVGNLGNRYAGHDLAQVQGQLQHHGYALQASHARALTGIDPDSRGAYYSASGLALSRVTPVGWFQVDGNRTRYRLGNAFAPLDPGGSVNVFGASSTQLLFADTARRWMVAAGLHRIHDNETVFDGAYALREQRYEVLDLTSEASWRPATTEGHTTSFDIAGGVKQGIGGSRGFSPGPGMAHDHFRIYTARADVDQTLGGGYSARFDFGLQATRDTVPTYEQWVLGGSAALAAWLPGTLVGDSGYLGRLTLQVPAWQPGAANVRLGLFAEHGTSRYHYVPPGGPAWQRLSDAGASLNLDLPGLDTHALLAYAHPLGASQVPHGWRRRQRAHAFFYLQLGF